MGVCRCGPGYEGVNCEIEVNLCDPNPCYNGAACMNSMLGFTCTCTTGYSGETCSTNINECASAPCQHMEGGQAARGIAWVRRSRAKEACYHVF